MNTKQVIVVIKNFTDANGKALQLRKGKIAAQASHAAMMFLMKKGQFFRGLSLYGASTSPSYDYAQRLWEPHSNSFARGDGLDD